MSPATHKDKVSIIIPTFNRAAILDRAIQSVLNQTYIDFELIIVDDNSSDNTEDIVSNYTDNRIRYLRHDENKGAGAARNTGIKEAKYEYIAFQDSDDEWAPNKLSKQMNLIRESPPEIGVVYTGFWRVEGDIKTYIPSRNVSQKKGDILLQLLQDNFVGTPTVIARKDCFQKVGLFDENLPCLEDWDLWIRIAKRYNFEIIDEPMVISHYTPGSVNYQSLEKEIFARKRILEKNSRDFCSKTILARHYFIIGNLYFLCGEQKRFRKYVLKALKLNPINYRMISGLFLSMLFPSMYSQILRKIGSSEYHFIS